MSDMDRMDDGARLWVYKVSRAQYWRVCSWYEFDDLVQDGLTVYCHVRRKYPAIVSRAHLMSLFKMAFFNHIHDLATQRTRERIEITGIDTFDFPPPRSIIVPPDQELSQLIEKAPQVVKSFLSVLATPAGRKRLQSLRRWKNGRQETHNERLCRILGFDPREINVRKEVYAYLSPTHRV